MAAKKKKMMRTLVIDRRRWKRGNPSDSSLLTPTGQMCCLGFYARSCGFSREEILEKGDLHDLVAENDRDPRGLCPRLLSREQLLIRVNDSEETRGAAREAELTRLFATHGVRLTFRG